MEGKHRGPEAVKRGEEIEEDSKPVEADGGYREWKAMETDGKP